MWPDLYFLSPLYCAGVISLALILDLVLGEVARFHPLVGLGNYIQWVQRRLWQNDKIKGCIAVALVVTVAVPFVWLPRVWWLDAILLYFVIGGRSLAQHGNSVAAALKHHGLVAGREKVAMIVSRKTDTLNEQQVVSAAVESVLENGNDALFGALFWFTVAGIPGAVLYRVSNTLDAMWGYKNDTFFHFGWAAAKLDDVLNYIPARLCGLAYALGGNTRQALTCWRGQASQCASPNGGVVMAAGAGSLNIIIGGAAEYDGYQCAKPLLGQGRVAVAADIVRASRLVWLSAIFWVLGLLMLALVMGDVYGG
ncbi:adenosylcobinamide-phosphate synthase CbiB [Shewanella benthica]|uniref:Cobalamin biosynthesis protein CobD n=1 Tax=Shewanella benthica KT99 TaxID=314608 RepID=A9D3D4_9GAMM|nr:adenosylcobinamide-phosphate synthase CbiB [Shewanella benthica]EDQ01666.1 cobalamin biosynthesis protein CobD [Shewanella benthica KT99]